MDAETAVEWLRKPNGSITTQNNKVADFVDRQEKYAELGRLALESIKNDKVDTDKLASVCQNPGEYNHKCRIVVECAWTNFCQKRAELLAEGQA